jgi:hypothetical protein
VGVALSVEVAAQDSDLPAQQLSYALSSGTHLGATIDPATGLFVWKPSAAQANTTNSFEVTVSDNGSPVLQATASFLVVVGPAPNAEPPAVSARVTGEACVLSWSAEAGRLYRVWFREAIGAGSWQQIGDVSASGPAANFTDPAALGAQGFYRIEVVR